MYVKRRNNSRRKPDWIVQGISWNDRLNAALQILFPKIQVLSDCKQLPLVGHLLDNILMMHVSVTDILFNLVLQAANTTMQPWNATQYLWLQKQLTSQEMIGNANNGCILQTVWLNTDTPSLLVKLWIYPSYIQFSIQFTMWYITTTFQHVQLFVSNMLPHQLFVGEFCFVFGYIKQMCSLNVVIKHYVTVVQSNSTEMMLICAVLCKRVPTPYFWPNFVYRAKVYLNDHPS